ncbi:MAG: carbon storage regulator [Planctomycetaceae bacterium]
MLHVTCGVNESFVIGGHIVVTVLEIDGDHVLVSVSDPQNDPPYWEQTVYCGAAETSELLVQ